MDKVSRLLKILPALSATPDLLTEPPPEHDPLKNLKLGVPYRLGVCGVPMSRIEYYGRRATLVDFLEEHSTKVRFTMDQVAQMTAENIDAAIYNSTNPSVPPSVQAEAAFRALAWHTFFDPFAHPKRKHYFKRDFLLPILEQGSDAYYKWAVYIKQQPDADVYAKMKTMHPQIVEHCYEYCANMMIAQREGFDASWMTTW